MSIAAALLLPFALMQADAAPSAAGDRFVTCIAAIDTDAVRAYEDAMSWAAEGQSLSAYRCAAMALVGQNRFPEAARRFESLATALGAHSPRLRGELFSQAGNAWLLDRDPGHARSAFTRAATLVEGDRGAMPDILIDRARAYAMEADYRHAEEDLSRALDMRPNDALALRLRASARMHQNSFELAEADAAAAVAVGPTDVDNLVMLGHTREARRTGAPVLEQ